MNKRSAPNIFVRWTILPGLVLLLSVSSALSASAAGNVFEYDSGWWFSSMNAQVSGNGTAQSDGVTNKSSEPVELTTTVEVAHWILVDNKGLRQDWRPSGPGMYASDAVTLTIESNEDVVMDLLAGLPAGDPNPDSDQHGPDQWFLFTTAGAPRWDEAVWLADDEINGPDDTPSFPGYSPQAGSQQYILWEKTRLDGGAWEQHRAVTLAIVNVRLWIDPYVQKYMPRGLASN